MINFSPDFNLSRLLPDPLLPKISIRGRIVFDPCARPFRNQPHHIRPLLSDHSCSTLPARLIAPPPKSPSRELLPPARTFLSLDGFLLSLLALRAVNEVLLPPFLSSPATS